MGRTQESLTLRYLDDEWVQYYTAEISPEPRPGMTDYGRLVCSCERHSCSVYRHFWSSIKEAPEDIRTISIDLGLLSSVLTRIAYEAQHIGPEANLVAALKGCWSQVESLTALLNEIEPGFASTGSRTRKWAAFKAVFKRGQLIKFQEALERMKCTLLLVQQIQDR